MRVKVEKTMKSEQKSSRKMKIKIEKTKSKKSTRK